MIKSIPAILLLSALLLPALGGYAWLQYQKSEVRREVENRKERGFVEEDLVLLRFSKAETKTVLRWEHAAEFEYLGQMYDIIRTEVKGDSLYYWCFWDEEETVLNRELAEVEKGLFNADSPQQEKREQLQQFYKSLIAIESPRSEISQPTTITNTFPFYLKPLGAVFLEPPSPPPRA